MPLSKEVLDEIKKSIDSMEADFKDLQELVADMRTAGYDVAEQMKRLSELRAEIQKAKAFYELQMRRYARTK
jgi:predicted  nucleic acid-binding Zn-ribbon protein